MARNPNLPPSERRLARIRGVLARRQKDLTLVLSNIHDPHNVSAIYRSCDAFGVHSVHLHYTSTAFPSLGRKSSGSARKWVETVRHKNRDELAAALHVMDATIIATSFSKDAKPVTDFDFTKPTAVIFGNEHSGVEDELKEIAHAEAYIPMMGMVQSLNVSVAAAVTLFEAWRQRNEAGMYDTPNMSSEELAALEAAWCKL
ncbi:tRNA methyltransferase [Oceanidesulfovibrio indonesiensis]|uniref:tRNA (guanosine(18)-2'-O)-methyltransferase n=1 Tax=Oceanidesulfovibrio indonesiensis TaxID=54767 RepID=A0A7M3MGK7_9BACT|nr:TrmH family RNA methyltransferase [Oceanidesulfovibrio indonesiensis]TVM18452.1 tRNA methyltransferase [Oceanidesulfovibrio indonesiensis]